MRLGIDEINKRSLPYKEYFGVMNITKKQIEARIALAERLEDEFFNILMLLSTLKEHSVTDDGITEKQLSQAYIDALISVGVEPDDYILELAAVFAAGFILATKEHPTDKWYTSNDRVVYNAENEANTVLNYTDYKDAVKNFKFKTWHTENDSRVRETHIPLEGTTLPIESYFIVGNALMRFPKDTELAENAPEEIINCRCSITYSN